MSRGGKRAGAGRKPREIPLKKITLAIEPDLAETLRVVAASRGKSQAQVVSEWLKRLRM